MRWYRSSNVLQRVLLVILGAFVACPLLWTVVRSFESSVSYKVENIPTFIGRFLSMKQYVNVLFYDYEYWVSYWNTILLTLPAILLAVGCGSMAAYGLNVVADKLQNRILFVYVLLSLLPAQVLLVPQLITLSNLHLVGTRTAVILISSCSPWYVFFLYRLCKRIPKEVLEMARVEGAGEWCIFRRIALPQMRLGLMIFGIIISADMWAMVEEPVVYIQDSAKYPLVVLFHEMDVAIPYAGVILFALPMVLLFMGGIKESMRGE